MPIDDPWRGIDPVIETSHINAQRVEDVGSLTWGLYWAIDSQNNCLLVLQHHSEYRCSRHLPKLRGLLIESLPTEGLSGECLVIRLTDSKQREIFHRFCMDIVIATKPACSEEEAVERFLVRTWRWHYLLKGGTDGRLSKEEQMGLIGELCVLKHRLLPLISPVYAVRAWRAPFGASRDFQVDLIGIEAKTFSPHVPTIWISSAEQLDATGTIRVFLHVTEVSESSGPESVTITDVVASIRDTITSRDKSAAILFEECLNATGFDWSDDYFDNKWLIGDSSIYEVVEGFPRITPPMLLQGVEKVQYAISLSLCESFRVDMSALDEAISGEGDGC